MRLLGRAAWIGMGLLTSSLTANPAVVSLVERLNDRSRFEHMVIDGEALSDHPDWNNEERLAAIDRFLEVYPETFPVLDGMTLLMDYSNPVTSAVSRIALRFPQEWHEGTPIVILVGDPKQYPPGAYPNSTWVINLPVSSSHATTMRDYHQIRDDCLSTLPQIKTGRALLIGMGDGSSAALQMANRHPERFSAVAFSGAPSPTPLPNISNKIIIHFKGNESDLDTRAGRAWIQLLNAQGNLHAYAVDGGVVDAVQFILDLESQEILPARGG